MNRSTLIILLVCVCQISAIEFVMTLPPREVRCFRRVLSDNAKYVVEVFPQQDLPYQVWLSRRYRADSLTIYNRSLANLEHVSLHKYSSEGEHSICVNNLDYDSNARFRFLFESGVDLLDFEDSAKADHTKRTEDSLKQLDEVLNVVAKSLETVEGVRSQTEQLMNMMSKKRIFLTVLGLFCVAALNLGFYSFSKKTLHQRKLI